MDSFKRSTYKTSFLTEVEEQSISCNSNLKATGREGIYEVEISIGTDKGITGINYNAFSLPDRFQLYFDGDIVADSMFVGSNLDYHEPFLEGTHLLPIYQYDGFTFVDSGLTEEVIVNAGDLANGSYSEPKEGKGKITFNKDKINSTMTLRVIGILGSTVWDITPICPIEEEEIILTNMFSPMYYKDFPGIECINFYSGNKIISVFSKENLMKIGTKLYKDKELLNKALDGYYYIGQNIHEVNEGIIIDKYPCQGEVFKKI